MSVGDINVKLGLDTTAFSSALARAKVEALALGGSFDGIGKSLDKLGVGGGSLGNMGKALAEIGTASNLATVGLAAIGVAAVAAGAKLAGMAAEYQSAMAKVAATTGMSNQQLKEMQGLMYQNAATGSRLSQVQQANIAGGLGAAGLIGSNTSAEEQLNLLKLTEKAMVALEAPVDDTINLFSILQTRYGATTEGMSKATSSIAQMADETSATNAEIIQGTLTMGRLASSVHMSIPEMIALTAATKASGIEAAEVGTQWSSLTRNLSSQTEGAAAAFEELGMSQDDWFKALQESKNTGSNAPVLRFLTQLDGALKKSDNSAKLSMQLFGSYGALLGGSIAQVVAKNDQLVISSQKAYDENVRIEQEYARMTDTMGSMLDAIGAKFNAIGVRMGTVLLKPIQDATYQFDQFLGKVMQGDFAGAWRGMYDAILDYDWVGAGMNIASMVASGLSGLASFAANAVAQLGYSLLTHDWIASGRSIADQIISGLSSIGGMAQSALGNISSWVNSGGATSAGRNLANWIIDGAQAVFGAGVDLLGWLRANLTMDKVAGIVRTAFNMGSELINLGIQAGKDFVGGIGSSITEHASETWGKLTKTAYDLVDDFTKVGQALANALTAGIASAMNTALNPVITKINDLFSGINQYSSKLGVTMPQFSPLALSGTNYGGVGTDYNKYWQETKSDFKQNTASLLSGSSKSDNTALAGATTYAINNKDPYAFFKEAGAQGMSYKEAMGIFNKTKGAMTQNQPLNLQSAAQAWGEGMSGAKLMSGYGTQTSGTSAGSATQAADTADALKTMANTWSGGVVPVEVQNWPAGFGTGAGGVTAGGTKIAGVNSYGQTVDANGLPVGKFDASKINTSGPGIGMVGSMSSTTPYANRLEVDTCEIDNFGMTPGLGAELAASGAWRPNAGAASQKLAAEIGYQGDYAEPSQYGNILGGLNSSIKTAATMQTTTANKVSGITVGAATKATGIQIGGTTQAVNTFASLTAQHAAKNAQTMDAAALNLKVSLDDGAYSCFNAIDGGAHTFSEEMALVDAEQKATSVAVRDNIMAGGQHVKENSLSSSLDFKNTIDSAGAGFKDNVNAGMASWTSALGSGLTSLAQIASYVTGGTAAMVGGGYTSTGNGITQTPWGAGSFGGTSISGGGSWVGTGASYSGAGAMAVSGGHFTSSNGVRWFADGGIVTKPSIVGVGEAGTEAIVPIGKLPDIMAQAMGGAGGAQLVHTIINVDGKRLADVTGPAIIKRVQQSAGLKVR